MLIANSYGTVRVLDDFNFFQNKTIGLSMSGGADSTLLCYLIAKSIDEKELNTTIIPYNGYDVSLPHDSLKLLEIINYIQTKFPNVDLKWPISTVFDSKGVDIKNEYLRPMRDHMFDKGYFDFLMIGINLGPPIEVQESFPSIKRLEGHTLDKQLKGPDKNLPFVNVDKRWIIQCYKDLNLLELYNKTSSCLHSDPGCGNCWWCYERNWAEKEVLNIGN